MSTVPQLGQADLDRMFAARLYDDIAAARAAGKFAVLLGAEAPLDDHNHILTRDDVRRLFAERNYSAIAKARHEGRIQDLLDPTPTAQEQ